MGVDVPANDRATGRRTVRPVSKPHGQGEQIPQVLHASPATGCVTQDDPQRYQAQGLSEAVGSHVHVDKPYQPEPINIRNTNDRTFGSVTPPPPVPPKVPLARLLCLLCDSQQATVEAAARAGAFCDECWTAAHRAAESATPSISAEVDAPKVGRGASIADSRELESPLNQTTTENTRRNRHVHFEAARSSRDGNVGGNAKDPSKPVGPIDHLLAGRPSQASVKQAQPLQDPTVTVSAQKTSNQEGRRTTLSYQSRVTLDKNKAKNVPALIDDQLHIAKNEPFLDAGAKISNSSVNDRILAVMKEEELRNTMRLEWGDQKGKPTSNRGSAVKNDCLNDKSKDASKGNLSVQGAKSAVEKAKGASKRDNAVMKPRSSVNRLENLSMENPSVIGTAKRFEPTPHAARQTRNDTTIDAPHDSKFLRVRKCEAGCLALCDFCSNLPAKLTTDVGLFCDHCWDNAMQAEADHGVLIRPSDLGDVASTRIPVVQECVRTDRRSQMVQDEERPEITPHHTSVEAAVEQRTCRFRGRPATVEVSDVGTLCQDCLGHFVKADKKAGNLDESLLHAEKSALQKHVQSGQRLGFAFDVQRQESLPHETPTEVAVQHPPCKCAGKQATFPVNDVGSLCWNCLGLVLEKDEPSGNLPISVSDSSKARIGVDKPSPASRIESEAIHRSRGSKALFSGDVTKKVESAAQTRAHGQ